MSQRKGGERFAQSAMRGSGPQNTPSSGEISRGPRVRTDNCMRDALVANKVGFPLLDKRFVGVQSSVNGIPKLM